MAFSLQDIRHCSWARGSTPLVFATYAKLLIKVATKRVHVLWHINIVQVDDPDVRCAFNKEVEAIAVYYRTKYFDERQDENVDILAKHIGL